MARQSRVRGAERIKERRDWPYPIPEYEWIERLNQVRRKIGDRNVAIITGVSLSDPTYKTVRRWAAGSRIPKADTYQRINAEWEKQESAVPLINVPVEIRGELQGEVTARYHSKVNLFARSIRPYIYRKESAEGMSPSAEAAERMRNPIYYRTCDETGNSSPPLRFAVAVILVHVYEVSGGRSTLAKTEVYLIWREDSPSPSLLKNAIDSWIIGLPNNVPYKHWEVVGVWYSYNRI